jgi:transcriptional regulator with XRE-family HTH domain
MVVPRPSLCESLDKGWGQGAPPFRSHGVQQLDFERLSAELLRALRGSRSQAAFARRLKYKSNIIYSWESGRAFPTAARALWAAERTGKDVRAALVSFLRREPAWFDLYDATEPLGVAALLNDLRGRTQVGEFAKAAERSRFAVARWLKGTAEPRLPDFLRLVETSTLRVLDLVALLVDPRELPSFAERWRQLEAARRSAFEQPWTQAIMRCLELQSYHQFATHPDGWIASQLGIDAIAERDALALLVESGQIEFRDGKYAPSADPHTVDTRREPEVAQRLRVFWSEVATGRLRRGGEGLFAYNVFSVSTADLERIRELHKAYYQEVRAIVAQSDPVDRVALLNLQLVPLT